MKVRELRKDVIDFHAYPGPDPSSRLAQRYGMKAIILKTQHYMGVATALVLERLIPGIRIFGGLCPERAVGGLKPRALEGGRLLPGVEEILHLVAGADIIVCSGPMAPEDCALFVTEGKKAGVGKIAPTDVNAR